MVGRCLHCHGCGATRTCLRRRFPWFPGRRPSCRRRSCCRHRSCRHRPANRQLRKSRRWCRRGWRLRPGRRRCVDRGAGIRACGVAHIGPEPHGSALATEPDPAPTPSPPALAPSPTSSGKAGVADMAAKKTAARRMPVEPGRLFEYLNGWRHAQFLMERAAASAAAHLEARSSSTGRAEIWAVVRPGLRRTGGRRFVVERAGRASFGVGVGMGTAAVTGGAAQISASSRASASLLARASSSARFAARPNSVALATALRLRRARCGLRRVPGAVRLRGLLLRPSGFSAPLRFRDAPSAGLPRAARRCPAPGPPPDTSAASALAAPFTCAAVRTSC